MCYTKLYYILFDFIFKISQGKVYIDFFPLLLHTIIFYFDQDKCYQYFTLDT